jgi:hypothetical protein
MDNITISFGGGNIGYIQAYYHTRSTGVRWILQICRKEGHQGFIMGKSTNDTIHRRRKDDRGDPEEALMIMGAF